MAYTGRSLIVLFLAGCGAQPVGETRDALASSQVDGFYWLTPIAPSQPQLVGTFDATLSPSVEIDGPDSTVVDTLPASLTDGDHYQANWSTRAYPLVAGTYRLRALLEGRELGVADVPLSSNAQLTRTLPIKLWLERCVRPEVCVRLTADETRQQPYVIDETTPLRVLDCQGHTLLPDTPGVDSQSATGYQPSSAEVAVAFWKVHDGEVRNCRIGNPTRRFDFGVVIVGNNTEDEPAACPPAVENRVHDNAIYVRSQGVSMFGSDNNFVEGNYIEQGGAGIGVHISRQSDCSVIRRNEIVDAGGPSTFVARFPGFLAIGESTDVGIFVFDGIMARNSVMNVGVAGRLYQLPVSSLHVTRNTIDGNTITMTDWQPNRTGIDCGVAGKLICKNGAAIVHPVMSSYTRVTNNIIQGGRTGILAEGFSWKQQTILPSTCSGDAGRICASNADCNIAPPVGTCGTPTPTIIDGRVLGSFDDHNLLIGPFGNGLLGSSTGHDAAIASFGNAIHGVITNNVIQANLPEGFQQAGIWLAQWALVDTVVSGNTVDGATVGLLLADGPTGTAALGITSFGARIYGNDFTGWTMFGAYASPADSPQGYVLPSELSSGGEGNYWSHALAPGFSSTDSNSDLVTDSHPFCTPVAGAAPLPAVCL
jgi:hypothetical protein